MIASTDSTPLVKRLSRNVALRRKSMAFTQAQIAEALGVDTDTVSRVERGKHVPSLATLERLAGVLQLGVSDLLAESDAAPASDLARIGGWLEGLDQADRSFLLDQLRRHAAYLRSRQGE